MIRQILHVDVNNAFLSWTALDLLRKGYEIDIRDIPSIIGGDESKRTGIVLAKSMIAKQCGIITGETIYQAKKKCPNLKKYSGSFKVYKEYSNKLYNLLLEYTDIIERFSIDECFLDMTNYLMNDSIIDKAIQIKDRVKEELGFTVNVGVAHNKLLAKMASDFTKPDRVHTLFEDEIPYKMWTLSVSELFMLGKKTVPRLYNMRIKTIGDLAQTDRKLLVEKFGKHGQMMWEYSNGIDNSEVQYKKTVPKSIGNSITLPKNVVCLEQLNEVLLALSEQVAYRLRKYNMKAMTINVQLRTKDFENTSHQGKLVVASSNTRDIYEKAKQLMEQMYIKQTQIRLVGLDATNLVNKDEMQISLFEDKNSKKQEKLDDVLDKVKKKYGYNMITRAGKMKIDKIINLKDE